MIAATRWRRRMKRYNVTRAANPFAMVVVSALMFLLLQRKLKSFEASWIPTRNLVTNWATSTQTSLNSLGESHIKKRNKEEEKKCEPGTSPVRGRLFRHDGTKTHEVNQILPKWGALLCSIHSSLCKRNNMHWLHKWVPQASTDSTLQHCHTSQRALLVPKKRWSRECWNGTNS